MNEYVLSCVLLQRLDISGTERLTADAPLSTGNVNDANPSDTAQRFTFDLDHCVGHLLDHFFLFIVAEDTVDDMKGLSTRGILEFLTCVDRNIVSRLMNKAYRRHTLDA